MVNTRSVVGHYDMAVVLKAQVDNLTGRNEELRRELHEVRFEAAKAQENLNKANFKACLCKLSLVKKFHSELKFRNSELHSSFSSF